MKSYVKKKNKAFLGCLSNMCLAADVSVRCLSLFSFTMCSWFVFPFISLINFIAKLQLLMAQQRWIFFSQQNFDMEQLCSRCWDQILFLSCFICMLWPWSLKNPQLHKSSFTLKFYTAQDPRLNVLFIQKSFKKRKKKKKNVWEWKRCSPTVTSTAIKTVALN